jgi:UDPglucose--hexose-1-phosphate uridylyltransferase
MSTLRKDPLTHGWVVFAQERFQPPAQVEAVTRKTPAENCPFCPGHEEMTAAEIASFRPVNSRRDTPGWSIRTVPNQFAALRIEGKFDRRGEGLYDMMNGIGAHEVIIESPEHDAFLRNFSIQKIQEILSMYRNRMSDLTRDQRFRHIEVFRNFGEAAGANLSHPHSQVVALPIIPAAVRDELQHSYDYWLLKERCLFCDIINQDSQSRRIVYENPDFIALEPFAARFPFETWIYPKEHSSSFHTALDSSLAALAEVLKITLNGIGQALANPPFNLIVHEAPVQPERQYHSQNADVSDHYHWHIEILPRTAKTGGFQFGTGFFINPVLPEDAAEYLRSVIEENLAEAESELSV